MSHGGAASSAMPQHQRRDPTAAGAATGPLAMKMSREGSREGFQGGLFWVPPSSFPDPAHLSGRDVFALPGCVHPPTPAARLRPFSSSLLVAFISLLPVLGLFFCLPAPFPALPWGRVGAHKPQRPFFGGTERPKATDEHRIAAQAQRCSHTEPSSTQPAAAWGQLSSPGLCRSSGQKYSYGGGKRKGEGDQGRLLKPVVVIKGKQNLMSSNA